jgi:hypothetical protein
MDEEPEKFTKVLLSESLDVKDKVKKKKTTKPEKVHIRNAWVITIVQSMLTKHTFTNQIINLAICEMIHPGG